MIAPFALVMTACVLGPVLSLCRSGRAEGPATQPTTAASSAAPAIPPRPALTPPDFVVSDVRVQTIAGFNFLYASFQTTFTKMSEPVGRAIADMEKGIAEGRIHPAGPLVFVYRDLNDVRRPFTVEVGFAVSDSTAAFGDYQLGKVEPFKCATALFSGPLSKVPDAYNKVMGALLPMNLKPTATTREFYLYARLAQ